MSEEHKAQGNAAFRDGRYEQAVGHFSKAIAVDGSNAVLFSNRSGAYASLAKYADALSDADRAIALRADWAKGYSRRAAALYGLGRYAESIAAYQHGLEIEPGNAQMVQAMSDVTAKLHEGRKLFEVAAASDLAGVRAALASGVHPDGHMAEDGTTALMAAARQGSAEVTAELLKAGAAAARKNRAGESAAMLARANGHAAVAKLLPADEKLFGASSLFTGLKGFANSAAAAASSAREIAEKAYADKAGRRPTASKDDAAPEAMGEEYEALIKQREERRRREETEQREEAMATKRKKIEGSLLREAEEEDLLLLREIAAAKTRADKDRAAEQAKVEEDERQRAAAAAQAAEDAAEAARVEGERQEREARVESLKAQGNDAFKHAQYAEAVQHYSQAAQLEPENAVLYSNRSAALSALCNYQQALADAEQCVSLRSDWAKGHTRKATALHGLKQYFSAVEAYDVALMLEPDSDALIRGRRQSSFALAIES